MLGACGSQALLLGPEEVEDQQQVEIRNQGSERSQRQSAVLLALASTLGAEL